MMRDELPEGWVWTTIGEITSYVSRGRSPQYVQEGGIPVINQRCVRWSGIEGRYLKRTNVGIATDLDPSAFVQVGDILWNSTGTGTIGRAALFRGLASGEQVLADSHVTVVRPSNYEPRLLLYWIMSSAVQDKIEDMQTGSTNQVELPRKEILATSVPVPPLAEQRRIVEKIEELFSLIEAGEQALEQAKKLLERYRQSVLKAAVTGELTREWRARHKDEIEPGEVLLRRILQARREAWEKAELDKMAKRGLTPKDDRWKQKYKEPEPPDTTSLPELPEGWVWASLDQLVSGEPRSLQSGPFGSNLRHSEFTEHGILVIGIDNVRNGTFSMGRGNRISYRKFQELSKYSARARDLLVTVMASLGRTCVVPPDLEAAIITKHVYRVSMNLDCLEPEFFNLVLQSDTTSRARMLANAQGQTRPGLNGSILSELPMPLPSLREQQESIRLVDEMLSSIRPILNAVEVEIRRSAALRQAILTAAFKGRLVPQDPADEPASALLERLRAERTAAGKPKPSRRGRPAEVAAGADGAPELPLG